jgi:hypothetical protein
LLQDKQCTNGSVAFKFQLHLQQILLLLCPELCKHPKTTKLYINTTKEEGDGTKLPSLSYTTIKEDDNTLTCHPLLLFLLFFRHKEEGDGSLLRLLCLFQQHHKK